MRKSSVLTAALLPALLATSSVDVEIKTPTALAVRTHCKCCRDYIHDETHRFNASAAQDSSCGWTGGVSQEDAPAGALASSHSLFRSTPTTSSGLFAEDGSNYAESMVPFFGALPDQRNLMASSYYVRPAFVALGVEDPKKCDGNDKECESELVQDGDTSHANFHSGTAPNSCTSTHIECNPDPEFSAFVAIDRKRYDDLARSIVNLGGTILINAERGLVQQMDCSGTSVKYQQRVDIARLSAALDEYLAELREKSAPPHNKWTKPF